MCCEDHYYIILLIDNSIIPKFHSAGNSYRAVGADGNAKTINPGFPVHKIGFGDCFYYSIKMLKFAMNLTDDGMVGQQVFAGEATRLAYMTDEAKEGRNAFLEKRKPNFKGR